MNFRSLGYDLEDWTTTIGQPARCRINALQ
jgi:hypothetical protein